MDLVVEVRELVKHMPEAMETEAGGSSCQHLEKAAACHEVCAAMTSPKGPKHLTVG